MHAAGIGECAARTGRRVMTMPSSSYKAQTYERYVSGNPTALDPARLKAQKKRCADIVRKVYPADKTARILELGCGTGALVAAARSLGYAAITGVDHSPEQI